MWVFERDRLDKIGHGHLYVEFDEVSKRMEHCIPICVSPQCLSLYPRRNKNLHKPVRNAHSPDDHNIHQERNNNHALIETDQVFILCQPIGHKIRLYGTNEEEVQTPVDAKVQRFLNAIPNGIDMDPSEAYQYKSVPTRKSTYLALI